MSKYKHVLASATAIALLVMGSVTASADRYESDPVGLFGGNGRYWIPRNGDGVGVIKLNRDGSAQMIWNKEPFHGRREQDGDRINTMWPGDTPFNAPSWRVRENSDPSKEYTATGSKP